MLLSYLEEAFELRTSRCSFPDADLPSALKRAVDDVGIRISDHAPPPAIGIITACSATLMQLTAPPSIAIGSTDFAFYG